MWNLKHNYFQLDCLWVMLILVIENKVLFLAINAKMFYIMNQFVVTPPHNKTHRVFYYDASNFSKFLSICAGKNPKLLWSIPSEGSSIMDGRGREFTSNMIKHLKSCEQRTTILQMLVLLLKNTFVLKLLNLFQEWSNQNYRCNCWICCFG